MIYALNDTGESISHVLNPKLTPREARVLAQPKKKPKARSSE
jgi:hypothetical protein